MVARICAEFEMFSYETIHKHNKREPTKTNRIQFSYRQIFQRKHAKLHRFGTKHWMARNKSAGNAAIGGGDGRTPG